MDIASDLRPDLISRLPEIPLQHKAIEYGCAFEVLEHLPFELLLPSFKELKRVSAKGVLISLPSQQEIRESTSYVKVVLGKIHYYLLLAEKN